MSTPGASGSLTFNFFDGMLAVSKSRFYTHDATYVFSNLNTWGWIIMVLGTLQLVAAFTLFGGSEFARWSESSPRA
jgi:hypothetical protein